MSVLPIVIACLLGTDPVRFQRHLIDNFPAGYQVAGAGIVALGFAGANPGANRGGR